MGGPVGGPVGGLVGCRGRISVATRRETWPRRGLPGQSAGQGLAVHSAGTVSAGQHLPVAGAPVLAPTEACQISDRAIHRGVEIWMDGWRSARFAGDCVPSDTLGEPASHSPAPPAAQPAGEHLYASADAGFVAFCWRCRPAFADGDGGWCASAHQQRRPVRRESPSSPRHLGGDMNPESRGPWPYSRPKRRGRVVGERFRKGRLSRTRMRWRLPFYRGCRWPMRGRAELPASSEVASTTVSLSDRRPVAEVRARGRRHEEPSGGCRTRGIAQRDEHHVGGGLGALERSCHHGGSVPTGGGTAAPRFGSDLCVAGLWTNPWASP
ncbi:hypothetical protein Ga0074812_1602 [Parafrankia irregularis]|uniref:Uncharacterized protein n=1 Tax=Parafrankia irregularis TaxID=795642 RepID=A0A0S4QZW6_9ACTN|nr:hypothetical protein Ga0074812_1602 [Parafrankia irregularis]